jgi:hypothetical protein
MIVGLKITWVYITLLSLSFWSSGLFLIRVLTAYSVWDSGIRFTALFALSLPLIYISSVSVKRIFARMGSETAAPLNFIIALVIILHALVLSIYPALYGFAPSPALAAAAWLLWFGGAAMAIARLTE